MHQISVVGLLKACAFLTLAATFIATASIPHHFFDLFSHFRLQYLGACVLLLLILAVLGEKTYALLLLLGVALNGIVIVPWYLPVDSTPGKTQLKVVHANVLAKNINYAALSDFLHSADPDVVFLQEFNFAWLEGTQGLRKHWPYVETQARDGNFGIAVFSKLPLEKAEAFDSPPLNHPSLEVSLIVNDTPVTMFSTHPMIPLGRNLFDARNQQMDHIAERVQQRMRHKGGHVVLLGDFNASMWDRHYRQLEENTGLRNARKGFGLAPSWPTFLLPAMIPIDHVLVSADIAVLDHRLGNRIGSDHVPLVVTLSF